MRTVIVDREAGIFVGTALGLAFFSMHDAAGQSCVCTFKDEADARDFVSEWTEPYDGTLEYVDLDIDADSADVSDLARAGLDDLLGDLLANAPAAASC